MSMSPSGSLSEAPYGTRGDWRESSMRHGYYPEQRRDRGGWSGWRIASLALMALGVAAFVYFEPDLRRYLKIKSM
jgi:Family of unknown function (DUF6893)